MIGSNSSINTSAWRGFFRTEAWVSAWLDTWGQHPGITLIDPVGRKHPLDLLYISRSRLKGIIPIRTLALAGVAAPGFLTPRAEYNHLDRFTRIESGFTSVLSAYSWHQCLFADVTDTDERLVRAWADQLGLSAERVKTDQAYFIEPTCFDDYLAQLSASTRLRYFNRRDRLAKEGLISFTNYPISQSSFFFDELDALHLARWQVPCYSKMTRLFLTNFMTRLVQSGGEAIMQTMHVNHERVSAVFDIVWKGIRYNLQSGFIEDRFPRIALGSLHLGYSIESALKSDYGYDFMAGTGKHSNYKESISTHQLPLHTVLIQKKWLATLKRLYRGR